MTLNGTHLYLRPLHVNDAEGNYPHWLNDPEVCQYNSHGDSTYTKEMARTYIESVTNNVTCKVFAICLNENDTHIGNIALQNISQKNSAAEYAILMGEKAYWGRGFAKEASELLFAYGFNIRHLHRIYCGTHQDNIAMQKLAKALHMRQEGLKKEAIFKNGTFADIIEYAILSHEYKKDTL